MLSTRTQASDFILVVEAVTRSARGPVVDLQLIVESGTEPTSLAASHPSLLHASEATSSTACGGHDMMRHYDTGRSKKHLNRTLNQKQN